MSVLTALLTRRKLLRNGALLVGFSLLGRAASASRPTVGEEQDGTRPQANREDRVMTEVATGDIPLK